MAIADRYFSKPELNALFSLPVEQQQQRFFDYWTLKEAYIKADGRGISLGLANFSFTIENASRIAISFSDKIQQAPAAWSFQLFYPEPDHHMALAVEGGQENLVISQFDTIHLI